MGDNIFLPTEWMSTESYLLFMSILGIIVLAVLVKLVTGRWEDEIDSRWGRGSIVDEWLYDRMDRRRRQRNGSNGSSGE